MISLKLACRNIRLVQKESGYKKRLKFLRADDIIEKRINVRESYYG